MDNKERKLDWFEKLVLEMASEALRNLLETSAPGKDPDLYHEAHQRACSVLSQFRLWLDPRHREIRTRPFSGINEVPEDRSPDMFVEDVFDCELLDDIEEIELDFDPIVVPEDFS